jgi:hypothetical protein
MPTMEEALKVVILGKRGCHLCELVEAEIRSIPGMKTSLTVVDVDRDPALHDKYWLRVPVVAVGGKDVFEAKMMDPEGRWRKRLPSLLRAS